MTEKASERITRHRRDATTSTTNTECRQTNEQPPREEGGTEAWLTVFGSFLVYYSSYGVLNSFGFFQDYYQNDFLKSTSPSMISFIGTLQITLMSSLATISGAVCDAHGIKYLYIASGPGTAVALLTLSFSKPIVSHVFLSQGLFMGLTIGFGVQPALTVVCQHFRNKRALAMGIVCAGSATGGVFFTIMFEKLLPIVGFSWTMRIAALKVLTCYWVAWWISTSKPTGRPIKLGTLLDFKGFLDVRYTVLALGTWFTNLGLFVPGYHINSYTLNVYPELAIGKYLLPFMNGCSIPGMIVGGLLGDHIGRLNLLWPMIQTSGFLCLSLWLLAPSPAVLVLFACLFGFSSGVFIALLPPVISQITPNEAIGARIGAFYSVAAVASLVGVPIGSALVERDESGVIGGREAYRGLIVFAGTTMLIASLVLLCGRLLHDRNLCAKW